MLQLSRAILSNWREQLEYRNVDVSRKVLHDDLAPLPSPFHPPTPWELEEEGSVDSLTGQTFQLLSTAAGCYLGVHDGAAQ